MTTMLPKLFGDSVWACQRRIEQQVAAAGLTCDVVTRPVWRNVVDRVELQESLQWPLQRSLEHEINQGSGAVRRPL